MASEKSRRLVADPQLPYLWRDENSGYWIVRGFHKGRSLFRSTGEKRSRPRAKALAKEIWADFIGTEQEISLIRFKDQWLKVLESKREGTRTKSGFKSHGELHLLPFFGKMPCVEIDETTWQKYLEHEATGPNPDRQLEHDWRYFREVMRSAFLNGVVRRMIVVPCPDSEEDVGREYSDEEIDRLRLNAGPDLRLQIDMALTMGMRKTEILKCEWAWVNLEREEIRLPGKGTKTRRHRTVAINRSVVLPELKRRYLSRRGKWVFHGFAQGNSHQPDYTRALGSNETAWAACKVRAEVEGRFHDLRHTCASRLMRAGYSKDQVGKALGMTPQVLDRIYWHMSQDDRAAMSNAIDLKNLRANSCDGKTEKIKPLKSRGKT